MSRLLTTGYETGSVAEAGTIVESGGTVTVISSNPTPRSGQYCLRTQITSSTAGNVAQISYTLGANLTEVWIRWAGYITPGALGSIVLLACYDSAGGEQMRIRINSDGLVGLYTPSNVLQANASFAIPMNAWHLFQVRYQITSITSSLVEVYLNGQQAISFSGDSVATSNANVWTIRLGIIEISTAGNWIHAIDDIAINDTSGTVNNGKPEDGRVLLLKPNGAGSSTQLSRGGTDSGANWSQVDETPPNGDTDYVYSANIGDRDLYTAENVPANASAIAVVEPIAYARNSDGGAGAIGLTVKSGATISESSPKTLTATYQFVRERWETDPNTGSAWTPSAVNAAEVGVTVR